MRPAPRPPPPPAPHTPTHTQTHSPSDFPPAAYENEKAAVEAFIAAVSKSFAETWGKAYSAKPSDCDPVDIWERNLTEKEKAAVRGTAHGRFATAVSAAAWVLVAAALARLVM